MTRTDVTEQDRLRAPMSEEATRYSETGERKTSHQVAAGGSAFEAIAGLAAVVLAIIGLVSSGSMQSYMATIATIVVGVAILLQGAAIGARLTALMREETSRSGDMQLGGGVSAAFLGGAAGVVLGILALLGMVPLTLVATAVIVLGSAMLISGGLPPELSHLESGRLSSQGRELGQAAALGAGGAHVLVGVAAIILGILALVGVNAMILSLVALLVLGGGIILSGGTVAGHMVSALHR